MKSAPKALEVVSEIAILDDVNVAFAPIAPQLSLSHC